VRTIRSISGSLRAEPIDVEDAEGYELIDQAVALPHDETDRPGRGIVMR
jgi:hypothetical protein